MNVIETAKIMAAKTRFFDLPPVELVLAIATSPGAIGRNRSLPVVVRRKD
jgi:hypothetical protein